MIQLEELGQIMTYLQSFIKEGLRTDGQHHKQWYLEQIAGLLHINIKDIDHEAGKVP